MPYGRRRDLLAHNVVDSLPTVGQCEMLYGRIPGVHQPVSRLVMGVDNQEDRAQAAAVFDDFVQRGGNCFDTAYIYGGGRMERLLGRWVSDRGIREHLVIVGK